MGYYGIWHRHKYTESRCRTDQGKAEGNRLLLLVTNKGKMIPTMLKVQDEDGEIRTVRQIEVHSQEEKMYAGVPSVEFNCTITILEQRINVWLIYYKEENRWTLVYRQE